MNKQSALLLVLCLLGILLLLAVSQFYEPKQSSIANLSEKNLSFFQTNKQVKVIANIISMKTFQNSSLIILGLEDSTGTIEGTFFSNKLFEFNSTREYEIIGKLSKYNNQTQISIDKISLF
jgi:RecG-like helicase